jgi:hypothetical protein
MRGLTSAAALALLLGSATPARAQEAPAEEEPTVLRYPPTSVRYSLVGAGVVMFGVPYGLSIMSAAVWPGTPGSTWLYGPVIGPWAALAQSGCSEDDPECDTAIVVVRGVLYVLDGFAQIGGLGLLGEGIFMTTEAEDEAPAPKTSIVVAPVASPEMSGVGVLGTF